MLKAEDILLSGTQAACLAALRHGKDIKTRIAIEARLTLQQAAAGLGTLRQLGLACQDAAKRWQVTARGKICRFQIVSDQRQGRPKHPGPGGRRLLDLLDRPMRGKEIVEKLGVTHQRVRHLLVALHAQGLVSFADPDMPMWLVIRSSDKAPVLSRDEVRVLSVLPRDYATNLTKIRLAARVAEGEVLQSLKHLIGCGYAEAFKGLHNEQVYRITPAGLGHPQFDPSAHRAIEPRMPVESDRVRLVLSAIQNRGRLRIRDLTAELNVPHRSMNALMQYLKRKALVEKTGDEFSAPYALTRKGSAALLELERRQAA